MSWELERLGDVAQVVRGVTYQKPALLSQGHPDGIPLLRATNVQNRYVDYEEPVTVPRSLVKDNQFLQPGDILIASSSGSESVVGKSAKIVESTPATFGAFCTLLRATSIDPDFLAYFVSSGALRQRWRASARGSNINNLKASEIAQTEVPVPPLDEQKSIVAQLEDQLGKLEAVRTGLQSASSSISMEYQSIALAELSKGARSAPAVRLKDLGLWSGGGTPDKSKPIFWDNPEVNWLTPKDMKMPSIHGTSVKVSRSAVSSGKLVELPAGAVAVVFRSGILAHTLPVAITDVPTTINQDMKALIPNSEVLPAFVWLAMWARSQEILTKCRKSGTTVASLDSGKFMNFEVQVPSIGTQHHVVDCFRDHSAALDSIDEKVNQSLVSIDLARASILHRAFLAPEEAL